ncbi:MAG TPA: DinB family protein [Halalkalibaculum sp.]|nr:DinB family protein [Halalkalibaculum sp.]
MRPQPEEYGAFYEGYIEEVGSGDIIDILKDQMHETYTLINSLTAKQSRYRYAEGKWTVKEVIGHLIDSERIFAYRGLCFARNETKSQPGYDQDAYVEEGNFKERSLQSLGDEYFSLRNATIILFNSFTEEVLLRKGTANDNTFSVRALAYIIAGHERHHLKVLEDKYHIST